MSSNTTDQTAYKSYLEEDGGRKGIFKWILSTDHKRIGLLYLYAMMGWFIVGASIFASNIGSEHLVGLAGSGCTDGVAMAHYELHAWCLLVLGWVLVYYADKSKTGSQIACFPGPHQRTSWGGSHVDPTGVARVAGR